MSLPNANSPSYNEGVSLLHGRIARGRHGLSETSLRPATLYPSMPCRRTTPEPALQPFQGSPTHTAGGLRPSSTPLDTPRRTPILLARDSSTCFLLSKAFQNICLLSFSEKESLGGGSDDQADAEWIVVRRPLWGHNDTPFGRPTPGRPVGRPGAGRPSGEFCMF
jgi:hypothetical protein